VKTIHWGPHAVVGPKGTKVALVETSDGVQYTSDFVVITVSLGVLKENAETMFNPALPHTKLNAVQVNNVGNHLDTEKSDCLASFFQGHAGDVGLLSPVQTCVGPISDFYASCSKKSFARWKMAST